MLRCSLAGPRSRYPRLVFLGCRDRSAIFFVTRHLPQGKIPSLQNPSFLDFSWYPLEIWVPAYFIRRWSNFVTWWHNTFWALHLPLSIFCKKYTRGALLSPISDFDLKSWICFQILYFFRYRSQFLILLENLGQVLEYYLSNS